MENNVLNATKFVERHKFFPVEILSAMSTALPLYADSHVLCAKRFLSLSVFFKFPAPLTKRIPLDQWMIPRGRLGIIGLEWVPKEAESGTLLPHVKIGSSVATKLVT